MATSLSGKCACGAVSYTIKENPGQFHACYCQTCQAWSGGVLLSVNGGKDPIIINGDKLSVWKSSSWAERAFCSTCGSSIYYKVTAPGPHENEIYFCAGSLDDFKGMKLHQELYIDRKPSGYVLQSPDGAEHPTLTKAEVEAKFS